jgi:hypothetical protein
MGIRLNFINRSNDANNSQIVIFQQDPASDSASPPAPWKVIRNCAPGDSHPFTLPETPAPTIWIGAVPQATEGKPPPPAILSSINTQISLLGVTSADLVMAGGGGPGFGPQQFTFSLTNVVTS